MSKYPAAIALLALFGLSASAVAQVAPTRTAVGPTSPATSTTTAPVAATAPTAPAPAAQAPAAGGGDDDEADTRDARHDRSRKGHDRIVMSGSTAGDVLTVTSITSGRLRVGTELSGTGLPAGGIVVTEFLTGDGGVGTYRFKPKQ